MKLSGDGRLLPKMSTLLQMSCGCGYYLEHYFILKHLRRLKGTPLENRSVHCPNCGVNISLSNININDAYYLDFLVHVASDNSIRVHSDIGGDTLDTLSVRTSSIQFKLDLIERGESSVDLLRELGIELYRALFPFKVYGDLRAAMSLADTLECGVRLRLVFDSPNLAALPWEFLYDEFSNTFLANNTRTVLSRYIDVPLQIRDLRGVSLPLKILLVISSPSDLHHLDTVGEERLIREALEARLVAGQIELDVLHEATIRNINQKLREKPYNVFHFIGHGIFETNQGFIALVGQDSKAKLIDDQGFANFFLGNSHLGLAVLNACEGATVSSIKALSGIAPHLVRRGVPAVVAMQYAVRDTMAKLFADEFYRALALGWPVDAAIQSTRNAIYMEVGLDQPDFATPVLYMRAKDGVILPLAPVNERAETPVALLPYDVTDKQVFISYAWGDESETIADELDRAFQARGVTIIRDKRELAFKGRIKEFMESIGRGRCVILVISEKYLKSENCLFELLQIAKHGAFTERIFPIVLEDARIYKAVDRIRYVQHWEKQLEELDKAMKTVSAANMDGFREDIDLYTEIRAQLPRLADILKDMNALIPEIHRESNFEQLFEAVMAKLSD